jgi:hypothetical protein
VRSESWARVSGGGTKSATSGSANVSLSGLAKTPLFLLMPGGWSRSACAECTTPRRCAPSARRPSRIPHIERQTSGALTPLVDSPFKRRFGDRLKWKTPGSRSLRGSLSGSGGAIGPTADGNKGACSKDALLLDVLKQRALPHQPSKARGTVSVSSFCNA